MSQVAEYDEAKTADEHDMPIRVVVRKRPLNSVELANGDTDCLDIQKEGNVTIRQPKLKMDMSEFVEELSFKLDDAFDSDATNEDIYNVSVKHLLKAVFAGGKATCFAYGQTGSGKTFTMMGSNPSDPASVEENAGLYVLMARDIYHQLHGPDNFGLKIYVSCYEIYGGKLYDLLNERNPIKCLEDAKGVVQTPALKEIIADDVDSLLDLMKTAHSQRSVGTTGANEESSRSHQILQLRVKDSIISNAIQQKTSDMTIGQFSFIDLAGSEKGSDTKNNSKQTRMEGAEINTSLLALKEVIRSLDKKNGFVSFRGSKLTQVLKDSFVGSNTKTCMIACVSPANSNCEHTINTLRYADRVKEHQISTRTDSNNECPPISEEITTSVMTPGNRTPGSRAQSPIPSKTPLQSTKTSPLQSTKTSPQQSTKTSPQQSPKPSAPPSTQTTPRQAANQTINVESANFSPLPSVVKNNRTIARHDSSVRVPRSKSDRSTTPSKMALLTKHLISSHEDALGEAIEMMNTELSLIRSMDGEFDEGDVEEYMDTLEALLDCQENSLESLRNEIQKFQMQLCSFFLSNET